MKRHPIEWINTRLLHYPSRIFLEILADIFNREKIDCMEIEAGLLVRRMRDGHYEWVIEL